MQGNWECGNRVEGRVRKLCWAIFKRSSWFDLKINKENEWYVKEEENIGSSEENPKEVAVPMHGVNPDTLDSKRVTEDMIKYEVVAEAEG